MGGTLTGHGTDGVSIWYCTAVALPHSRVLGCHRDEYGMEILRDRQREQSHGLTVWNISEPRKKLGRGEVVYPRPAHAPMGLSGCSGTQLDLYSQGFLFLHPPPLPQLDNTGCRWNSNYVPVKFFVPKRKNENIHIFSPVIPANTMSTLEDEWPQSLPSSAEGPAGEKLQYELSQIQLHFSAGHLILLLSCRAETEDFIQEIILGT